MATRQMLVDDIDGSQVDVQSVMFVVNGTTYAMDLGPTNRAAVVEALQPFIAHAQTKRTARAARSGGKAHGSGDVAALRNWARSNGFEIGDRGRIPQNVRDAYAAR
jgi:Lsr2